MFNLNALLAKREEEGRPIRVALVGAGRFGGLVLAQTARMKGMRIAMVCDLAPHRALAALQRAGFPPEAVCLTSSEGTGADAISRGQTVLTDAFSLCLLPQVEVVVEATGSPEAGALHAFQAIQHGKHVVMVNVEADVLVGPLLKRLADRAGVVYSLAYSDQPALIKELYDWATTLGFEVVAAGEWRRYTPEMRYGTPEDALQRFGFSSEQIARGDLNPQMFNSFLDGSKGAVEACAVANMTGLVPDVRGTHLAPAGVPDLPRLLCPREEGGILSRKGVVELVTSLYPDGRPVPQSLPQGVFIVFTHPNPYTLQALQEYGLPVSPNGRYIAFYRPYHLVGAECPVSIAWAALRREATGEPIGHYAEVIACAKRPLEPGQVLDGEGGYTVYGAVERASVALREGLLPLGLARGARLKRPLPADAPIPWDAVEVPEGFALHLRRLQDRLLAPAPG
ncbi:MAG: NAD(P)H-dependent oxidoreductase [Dehalococcoidia bacterium]